MALGHRQRQRSQHSARPRWFQKKFNLKKMTHVDYLLKQYQHRDYSYFIKGEKKSLE